MPCARTSAPCKQAVGDKILKVIIETCLLTDDEKRRMCDIVCEAGADYIKTSTGFSTAGATFHDVELMVKGVAWPLQGQGCWRHLHRGRYGEVPRPRRRPSGYLPRRQDPERRAGKGLLRIYPQWNRQRAQLRLCLFCLRGRLRSGTKRNEGGCINFRKMPKKSAALS